MSLAFNRFLSPEIGRSEPPIDEQESGINIAVPFTSLEPTITALKKAGQLAESLGARITLIVLQVVPYPLPLTSPPVLLDFQERRFRGIASESPVEIQVQLYLCRDALVTLKIVLRPKSLVVLGGRRRWWPTREKSLARKLRAAGHEVIVTDGVGHLSRY